MTFTRLFAMLALAVGGLVVASAASAALICDTLEYDGHVKSGAATGVEKHGLAPVSPSTVFDLSTPPNTADFFTLPVTNGPLTAPLLAAHALDGSSATEFASAFNGQPAQQVVITLQQSNALGQAFINGLDPGIALPILFDGTFHTSVAGQKIDLVHIGIESIPAINLPPFSDPGSSTITGLGTAANPLHIQLGLSASEVESHNGVAKVHLWYTTSNVPEPATWLMLMTGSIGLIGFAARRQG
jgi:PEP-CTERM motif